MSNEEGSDPRDAQKVGGMRVVQKKRSGSKGESDAPGANNVETSLQPQAQESLKKELAGERSEREHAHNNDQQASKDYKEQDGKSRGFRNPDSTGKPPITH
eukprot:TRINITY_DN298_c0_g1_i1.p1 TRINITY_DN298_c0_g1~~TRINITY_DN298_c0_g1_i1.p1  ORF type:complete len:101 (+),score=37.45 TRINITY_DN298_c0_g1_i1:52-354(+)